MNLKTFFYYFSIFQTLPFLKIVGATTLTVNELIKMNNLLVSMFGAIFFLYLNFLQMKDNQNESPFNLLQTDRQTDRRTGGQTQMNFVFQTLSFQSREYLLLFYWKRRIEIVSSGTSTLMSYFKKENI